MRSMNDNGSEHEQRLRAMTYCGGYEQFKKECEWKFAAWLDQVLRGEADTPHQLEVVGILKVRDDGDYVPEVRFNATHPLTLRPRSL